MQRLLARQILIGKDALITRDMAWLFFVPCTTALAPGDNFEAVCREEVLEFAIGGDLAEKADEQIDFEAWDYHWVNRPGDLTW